ncbi:helix-turn-helix domain-containing protein [Paenibacillus sp. LMG 31459]|jgi:AraC-like DNA-binding protein/mannose-6-phosphate isomerase-like protein (cupin superfamily)|uniref:Helix-turn-helix domain-containing protein n=1 Tax=Paenibacillus phytohabitans TaxID=2654978 RepID=A0ABX1YHN0_9BACL|nr:helix-turn-helix domain-containing protein [Paenibacillus phytohabitans]NOU79373.1 helix-turn-helix domain-containing protein [Paenibacillus phytohabitans]
MRAFHENRTYGTAFPFTAFVSHNIDFLAHWHNDLEIIYVLEGSIRMGINSETRVLQAGDLAVCSSGDIHYYDSKDNTSKLILVIFNPALIGFPAGWPLNLRLTSPFRENRPSTPEDELINRRLSAIMQELLQEHLLKPPHHEQLMTGLLHELCALILRHMPLGLVNPHKDKRRITNMKIMQEVLEYLDVNYMHPITLADAANHANMSLFYFSRFFKSISGMSYISYLNSIRVNQAERLLLNTDTSILDIALECGFSNIRTFNRVFKQVKQRTPSELR